MTTEIERKYLAIPSGKLHHILETTTGCTYHQAYLCLDPERTIRVRIDETQHLAWMTIKGMGNGLSRPEFEYTIPVEDARRMMEMAVSSLSKTRYRYPFQGFVFEIDVFHGKHDGLILVEVELENEEQQPELPEWVGTEVTYITRYSNAALSQQ